LANDRNLDRKLRTLSGSRFFWLYSLSLWEPDAFWKCVSGAATIATLGLLMTSVLTGQLTRLDGISAVEYFLLGLALMWRYNLGAWLYPTNLLVIFTFIFRLYRKNKTVDDLSAEELGRLFPGPGSAANAKSLSAKVLAFLRRSPVLGSLLIGCCLALFLVSLLIIGS
jgi:hypothetical protein